MRNLLVETLKTLEENSKAPKDVQWVGSETYGYITWDEFAKIANIEYDAGYGSSEVAQDLLIVGSDWWLERGEYDGSEWWEYNTIPVKPSERVNLRALTIDQAEEIGADVSVGWENLKNMNKVPQES